MKTLPMYLLAAALLALCGCSSLPRETLSPSDLTVEELEQRMAKATDPEGHYAKAQSFVMRQELTTKRFLDSPLIQMVETKYMRPDCFKITTYDDNKPSLAIISNGVNSRFVRTAVDRPAAWADRFVILFTGRYGKEKSHRSRTVGVWR